MYANKLGNGQIPRKYKNYKFPSYGNQWGGKNLRRLVISKEVT